MARPFAVRGLEELHGEPHPGPGRTLTDAHVERVITTTLESTSENAIHWSMEHTSFGRAPGDEPIGDLAHLTRLRAAAAPERDL